MRFVIAATVGYGVDESYAVAIGRQFSLSYFDHPPLMFWIAGGWAKLASSEAPVVLRLPFALCFTGTTWLMYRLGARFFGEWAGALAALLLNISAEFSLSAGGWILPDGPLMLATMASVTIIVSILFDEAPSHPLLRWLLAGALAGVAMLAKYHGIFVLGGTFLFLLTCAPHRKWLATPGPYLGALVAFAFFSPVLIWNSEHGWVSFLFQGSRAGGQGGVHLDSMLQNIAGQVGYVLPWIWIPLVVTLFGAVRGGPRDAARWLIVCLAVGPIVAFTMIALRGDPGLPHWTAPGYLLLFPLLGAAVSARLERGDRLTSRWLSASITSFAVLIAILGSAAATGWIGRLPGEIAKADAQTADLLDWVEVRGAIADRRLPGAGGFVAAASWIQGGKVAVGVGPGVPVICLCADPHHFRYATVDTQYLGRDAVLAVRVREGDDPKARSADYFESREPITTVPIMRDGRVAMQVALFRGVNFRKVFPTTQPR